MKKGNGIVLWPHARGHLSRLHVTHLTRTMEFVELARVSPVSQSSDADADDVLARENPARVAH